ncbi:ABC transporter ATP-binding protein [Polaribacter sp. SA4-12]|uniref:ABC transporter ATP-binding protein n=1 Tax=Polaribacter sp. SA4-12 TaxID=1312072 RepID=UPI000B3D44CA|nr:ABC transporter ATP-binding protein [Polaribacter sp. SA4-12]ARV13796.1 ABC transporter ATP-binding protein [Polaribacter sp. SA4-12]
MSEVILKVENVSKQYRLGLVGTGTIKDDLKRWWYQLKGKEDPFLKIGDANDRSTKGESDYVWALKNIDFEVNKGEVLGVIGKNGAGKSTLLKILSKITSPTTGSIKFNGRIASLLEVGTGFHPELTGKENVYLNGAILGMTKAEISDKYDEIIEFSGCERYIDTPVKRYSSGMTVRLAFAVAAFLEPDILIIDEVLAVGDAEFQKKAIGKMQDISKGEGRTVLFVSHNMTAVKNLCTRCINLENGIVTFDGDVKEAVDKYLTVEKKIFEIDLKNRVDRKGTGKVKFKSVEFLNKKNEKLDHISSGIPLNIKCVFDNYLSEDKVYKARFDVNIYNENEVFLTQLTTFSDKKECIINSKNEFFTILIPKLNLLQGKYILSIYCKINEDEADWIENAVCFDVQSGDYFNSGRVMPKGFGIFATDHKVNIT